MAWETPRRQRNDRPAMGDNLGIHSHQHQFPHHGNPQSPGEAFATIGDWLTQPGVVALQPGPLHASILEKLVCENGATGPMVTDAVLAALAIEYGALLASTDQDFRRFPELRWVNPCD